MRYFMLPTFGVEAEVDRFFWCVIFSHRAGNTKIRHLTGFWNRRGGDDHRTRLRPRKYRIFGAFEGVIRKIDSILCPLGNLQITPFGPKWYKAGSAENHRKHVRARKDLPDRVGYKVHEQ